MFKLQPIILMIISFDSFGSVIFNDGLNDMEQTNPKLIQGMKLQRYKSGLICSISDMLCFHNKFPSHQRRLLNLTTNKILGIQLYQKVGENCY